MLLKLFALSLAAANPAPLALKTTEGAWYEKLIIEKIDIPQIKRTIYNLWGLDINDFKWSEEKLWFEHDGYHLDTAYELRFGDSCTIFYERFR